jgi:hypothetical protein
VLVQPNRVGISPDELVNVHAIDRRRAPDALLLSMNENGHELLSPLLARPLFCGAEFSFMSCHG